MAGTELASVQERNIEDAILGAQMLINNPEAAAQVLLGSDMYPQLQQMMQSQGFDTTRADGFAAAAAAAAAVTSPSGQQRASLEDAMGTAGMGSQNSSSVNDDVEMDEDNIEIPNIVVPVPRQPGPGGMRAPILLYTQADFNTLSKYQCLIRQQIEMFEATEDDVQFNISRMSKIIVLGQVGIRCRHCAVLPQHSRPKASVYYPRTLDSMYQFGQNMVKNHLCACCELIPTEVKDMLINLQGARKRGRGGRDRWAQAAHEMGVIEDENGLRFR